MQNKDSGGLDFATAVSISSAEVLDRLSRSPDNIVRWGVAGNTYTPTATLIYLASDIEDRVVEQVKNNPSTPPAVKLWLQTAYGQMSLEEFLNAVDSSG